MADDGRNSGMRGRASRRGAAAPEAEAASAEYEDLAGADDDDAGGWKVEVDSITNGAPARARRGAFTSPRPAPCAARRARAASASTSAAWPRWIAAHLTRLLCTWQAHTRSCSPS